MIKNIFRLMTIKKQRAEMKLVKPIYLILNDDGLKYYEEQWNNLKLNYETLHQYEDEIDLIITYTTRKLEELSIYLESGSSTKRRQRTLSFYREYLEILLKHTKNKIKSEDILQFMYLYNELLLGSKRFLTIKEEIESFGSSIRGAGSIT